jgi:tRNA 2-selenouridine synthase
MAAAPVTDYRHVLRERTPLIDLRAPAEFARGAFPHAVNLPLLDDTERAAVGTRYRERGQAAAIALGESLVAGATRTGRIDAWRQFVAEHPSTHLYCWRGGLRSRIAQQWLGECGVEVPRIGGGYRALRRTCIEAIDEFACSERILVIGGRTGSGKTVLLQTVAGAVDLEALANHRGSAFGAMRTAQPPPIAFENALGIELLRRPAGTVLLEDESRTIGRLAVPEPLHRAMQRAPLVVLEVSRHKRAEHIFDEYVAAPLRSGVDPGDLKLRFEAATDRIRRRLGGVRHLAVRRAIEAAFTGSAGASDRHVEWIELLLEWYYDPMYDYQLQGKQTRIVARGDAATIQTYLARAFTAD